MKNEQLASQLRLAASILETGHPWEFLRVGVDASWRSPAKEPLRSHSFLDLFTDGYEIRLALATPGDSRPLHNPNNLTAEQVGAGWRLCLKEELGIAALDGQYQGWDSAKKEWETGCEGTMNCYTYRLPLSTPWPEAPKVDSFADLKSAHAVGKVIQHNHLSVSSDPCWKDCAEPNWESPVWRYRIKPDPVLIPLEAVDVPPGSVIGYNNQWCMVTCACRSGFQMGQSRGELATVSWDEAMRLHKINRSIPKTGKWDSKAWEKCEKEAT